MEQGTGGRNGNSKWAVRVSYAVFLLVASLIGVGVSMLLAERSSYVETQKQITDIRSECGDRITELDKGVANHEQRLKWLEDNIKAGQVEMLNEIKAMRREMEKK